MLTFYCSYVCGCLTGIMLFVGSIAALMGNLIAKKVISVLGELNIIFIGIIIESSRLVLWAVIR